MTDRIDSSNDHNHDNCPQGSKQLKNRKTLDTLFPATWLLILMVGVVLILNILLGVKVFSLQKEKAVIEILKARYDSYEKIIRDVEDKEESLRTLTQEIVPLEKRTENAQNEAITSNKKVKKNKADLNKIKAKKAEVVEELSVAQTTIAELSNKKQTLRKEKGKLEKLVAELKIEEERIEKEAIEKRYELRITKENIRVAKVRLKDQQKYLKDVAAANSSFESLREQLVEFVKKMNETQAGADERIKDLKVVITSIAYENEQLSSQAASLTNEANTLAQSNETILTEINALNGQNKNYKAEVANIASTSRQMKNFVEAIKGATMNIEIDEAMVSANAKAIKSNLRQVATVSQNLVQTSKQLTSTVTDVTSQKEKLDEFMQEITNLPDMNAQATAFQNVLREIEETAKKLSERVSAIQSGFEGKLDGMNLSFGTLKRDFTELLRKIDGVEQTLGKIATQTQRKPKNLNGPPSDSSEAL